MAVPEGPFRQSWPRCFVAFMGVIELLATAILFATELGNVAANFWTTNVFAGGWCGLVMLVHFMALFVAGCCSPKPSAAFRAVIITIVALLACGCLIGFDATFIAQPTTCILTSSCATNAASTTSVYYYFQQAFFTLFKNLSTFSSYTQTQAKFLFQTIQLGVGCLCFVLCVIYLIIYYVCTSKAKKQVGLGQQSYQDYPAPQAQSQSQSQSQYQRQYQQPGPAYRSPPRVPQARPGENPWNGGGKY